MSEENKNMFDDSTEDSLNAEESTVNNESSVNDDNADTLYFTEDLQDDQEENNEAEPKKKEKRRVSLKVFVVSLIAVLVAAVMLTYSICSSIYQSLYAKAYVDANKNSFINGNVTSSGINELDVIAKIINDNYYGEVDSKKLMDAAIAAYVKQTGDVYAA